MRYTIQCCGPSKDFFSTIEVSVEAKTAINSTELKALLLSHVSLNANKAEAQSMLSVSLIASSEKVLDHQSLLPLNEKLFLLPPVCGG